MTSARRCPCSSGLSYAECCGPLHRGEREAPDALALMRSRYAAFATRRVDYLWRTLHPDHDDRALPREEMLARLRRVCDTHKYTGLTILDRKPPDQAGIARVLFFARVFSRGQDLSFVELSLFARDEAGWRYLTGHTVRRPDAAALATLTIDALEAPSGS